jgi:hypothetical protein
MNRITILLLMTATAALAQNKVSFEKPGALPEGWESGVTGQGVAKWEIVRDDAPASPPFVLKQSGEATFCWAAKMDDRLKDGFAEVKFKPLSGKEDQAGGLIFRMQDGNNYYVVRGNALENNVVLYKTVGGKRSSLPVKGKTFGYGVDAKIASGRWNTLRVDFAGKRFIVSLNGSKLFEVEDETLNDAGGVGVWTKADSVTVFDDFTYGTK